MIGRMGRWGVPSCLVNNMLKTEDLNFTFNSFLQKTLPKYAITNIMGVDLVRSVWLDAEKEWRMNKASVRSYICGTEYKKVRTCSCKIVWRHQEEFAEKWIGEVRETENRRTFATVQINLIIFVLRFPWVCPNPLASGIHPRLSPHEWASVKTKLLVLLSLLRELKKSDIFFQLQYESIDSFCFPFEFAVKFKSYYHAFMFNKKPFNKPYFIVNIYI